MERDGRGENVGRLTMFNTATSQELSAIGERLMGRGVP